MKINTTKKTRKTVNAEGAPAYNLKEKEEFVTGVLTSFYNEKKFYETDSARLDALAQKLVESDPSFVAKTAIFARNQMYLRTFPTVLAGLICNNAPQFIEQVIDGVIQRPDQLTELVAWMNKVDPTHKLAKNGTSIGQFKKMKKAIAKKLTAFDEYQLSKWKSGSVRLMDVVRIYHPKPLNEEQGKLWGSLINGTIATPMTWETELSAKGNKAEVWDNLIESGKLPYMAALRNLRNIIQSKAKNLPKVLDMISNEKAVRRSKQFPFRFYSAYKELGEVGGAGRVLSALSKAIDYSADNVPELGGKTVIAIDLSGSMTGSLSQKSSLKYVDVASIIGATIFKKNPDALVIGFHSNLVPLFINPSDSILTNAKIIAKANGGATYGYLVVEKLIKEKIDADRVIFVTDMQLYGASSWGNEDIKSLWAKYKKTHPDTWLHVIDLAGYGNMPIDKYSGQKINLVAGFNDNIFKYISMVEGGLDGLMEDINKVEL